MQEIKSPTGLRMKISGVVGSVKTIIQFLIVLSRYITSFSFLIFFLQHDKVVLIVSYSFSYIQDRNY